MGLLFSEKTALEICSIIIAAVGMLGSIWMDIDSIGGILAAAASKQCVRL
ncbi:MAG TPA: hypothetical protein H9669_06400 [Firmicutes bacterium]|nr:hypothetical protein [Bacillota bacterium]